MTGIVERSGRLRLLGEPSLSRLPRAAGLAGAAPSVGVTGYVVRVLEDGRAELRDGAGHVAGLFASEQLANTSAAFMNGRSVA